MPIKVCRFTVILLEIVVEQQHEGPTALDDTPPGQNPEPLSQVPGSPAIGMWPPEMGDLPGARSGGKFVASRAGEA
jgi:hypothetical protein